MDEHCRNGITCEGPSNCSCAGGECVSARTRTAPRRLEPLTPEHRAVLEKRRTWLTKRVTEAAASGKDLSWDKAEISALGHALALDAAVGVRRAEAEAALTMTCTTCEARWTRNVDGSWTLAPGYTPDTCCAFLRSRA